MVIWDEKSCRAKVRLRFLVFPEIERVLGIAMLGLSETMKIDVGIQKHSHDFIVSIHMHTVGTPRADYNASIPCDLEKVFIVLSPDWFQMGLHGLGIGGAKAKDVQHVQSTIPPFSGIVHASTDCRIIYGLIGCRWIQADECTLGFLPIPDSYQEISKGSFARENCATLH
jgi:hypothetical protein